MKKLILNSLNFCASGFSSDELTSIKTMIQDNGGKFQENLLKTTNVLICKKVNTDKYHVK